MSMETMAWMRMKVNDEADLEGFKAFIKLIQYNNVTIEDPQTGSILAFITGHNNEELYDKLDQIDSSSELTLMGSGDSWSFESARTLINMFIEYRESILNDMLVREEDKNDLTKLFDQLEQSRPRVTFSQLVFRQEDINLLEGFNEFVWCSYHGCDRPAEYNGKKLKNGKLKGRDDFPASIPLTEEDIPYCEKHFEEIR